MQFQDDSFVRGPRRRVGPLSICAVSISLGLAVAVFSGAARPLADSNVAAPRFWKGNTHTHTLWSDGDAAPESVAKWYKDHGYNFLVLSDHNIFLTEEKWVSYGDDKKARTTTARVEELKKVFGEEKVKVRQTGALSEMKLWTLPELEKYFAKKDEFIFIPGEEITDAWGVKAVHINGINLTETIKPQHGATVVETINKNIDAVHEQGQRTGKPVLAHINHPNYGWSLTWEDLARIVNDRFFEVYNGHSGVNNYGDEKRESTEKMWDLALTLRLTELGLGVLYGVATDDSHSYFKWGVGNVNPGRGWVMVRSKELSGDAIVTAMRAGDFYGSSGVVLKDFSATNDEYRIAIDVPAGETMTTRFIGSIVENKKVVATGEVLAETKENPAVYRFRGDELYVRAVVTSSKKHPNPYKAGDFEQAWLQPVVPRVASIR